MIPRLQIRGRSRVQLGRIHLNLSYCTKNVSIIYRFVFADQNTRLSLYLYLHASSLNTARRDKPCINTIRPSGRVFYALYPGGYPIGQLGSWGIFVCGRVGKPLEPYPKNTPELFIKGGGPNCNFPVFARRRQYTFFPFNELYQFWLFMSFLPLILPWDGEMPMMGPGGFPRN